MEETFLVNCSQQMIGVILPRKLTALKSIPLKQENHLKQTSIFGFKMLVLGYKPELFHSVDKILHCIALRLR